MRDKWNVNNKNKGYLKIHVAVNIKYKKILSIEVTNDEYAHDGKALPELVENIIKPDNVTVAIGKLFADDGAYSNDILRYLSADNGILPCIKVRKMLKFY